MNRICKENIRGTSEGQGVFDVLEIKSEEPDADGLGMRTEEGKR